MLVSTGVKYLFVLLDILPAFLRLQQAQVCLLDSCRVQDWQVISSVLLISVCAEPNTGILTLFFETWFHYATQTGFKAMPLPPGCWGCRQASSPLAALTTTYPPGSSVIPLYFSKKLDFKTAQNWCEQM